MACAVALSKVPGIEVHIYEAASAFTEIGAGVGTWSRGWEVLKRLGLGQELGSLAGPIAAKEGPSESPPSEIPGTANLLQLIKFLSPCISLSQVRSSRRRTAVRFQRPRCV